MVQILIFEIVVSKRLSRKCIYVTISDSSKPFICTFWQHKSRTFNKAIKSLFQIRYIPFSSRFFTLMQKHTRWQRFLSAPLLWQTKPRNKDIWPPAIALVSSRWWVTAQLKVALHVHRVGMPYIKHFIAPIFAKTTVRTRLSFELSKLTTVFAWVYIWTRSWDPNMLHLLLAVGQYQKLLSLIAGSWRPIFLRKMYPREARYDRKNVHGMCCRDSASER